MTRFHRSPRSAAISALLAALIPLLAAGCGHADAENAPFFHWMGEKVKEMPGYEVEPETFDRYAEEAHPAARVVAFSGGKDPDDPKVRRAYIVEIHRYMLERAFSEGRTDLADILTRAYVAAQAAK